MALREPFRGCRAGAKRRARLATWRMRYKLDKLVRRAVTVVEIRLWGRFLAISTVNHPLSHVLAGQSSSLRSVRLNTFSDSGPARVPSPP